MQRHMCIMLVMLALIMGLRNIFAMPALMMEGLIPISFIISMP